MDVEAGRGAAWGYLEQLSRLPHRGSATEQEAAAADLIRRWLEELGYAVSVQVFRAPRDTLYLGPAAVLLGLVLAAALGLRWPWAGLGLSAALLAPLVGELLGSSRLDLDWLLPRHPSRNVVARLAPSGTARRTLVISAHYDTQRASYLFHPSFRPFLQAYFYVAYTGMAAAPQGLALQLALPGHGWPRLLVAAASALNAANGLFLLLCRLTGRYVNGANDNGSGVALALALAQRLARRPLPGLELVFLFTGAEEVGTRGMKHFLRHARLDPATTRFINLDNLGGGTLHYLTGEGMLTYQRYGPELLALAERLAAEYPGRLRPRHNLLLPTDGWIPALAGYEVISFLAFGQDGFPPEYHWYTDTPERVDRQLLELAEEVLLRYVERVAGLAS